MDVVKSVYKVKDLPNDRVSHPIVTKQGEQFNKAIDGAFDIIDFDSPDYYMREVLKRNAWQFSVAKNYNDLTRLNNLLIRDDGSLRPWNEFKREAQKVVGDSIKYLKTEYNTIVAGAQMSRLWAEIQRDKEIFPFAQFVVVMDGRTSEICSPLHDVIVSVDDPMLAYYFPPNHFNCRTTVKKLRYGVPTEKYNLPDIPEAFQNNVGQTGEIFTDENRYIKNTPKEVLKLSDDFYYNNKRNERYQDINFKQEKIGKGVLEIFTNGRQNKNEYLSNKEAFQILAKKGYKIRMLPVINIDKQTNPDGFNLVTKKYIDVKNVVSSNGKNIIQSSMKEASKQEASELVIYLRQKPHSYRDMYLGLKTTMLAGRSKNVEKIIIIFPDKSVKEYNLKMILSKITKR